MTKFILSTLLLALTTTFAFGQVTEKAERFPDRASAGDLVRNSAIETFQSEFNPQESGILHVYIDPSFDPEEVYLFRGREASGTLKALLPRKYQEMAKRMNATVYATAAIKGIDNEDFYLVRFDGQYEDRIEMFAIEGYQIKHVKTMATRSCASGKCVQMDTWVTDIDGDTDPEFIEIRRTMRGDKNTAEKKIVYTYTENGKWKKSKTLAQDAPWSTVEFFDNGN